MCHSACNVPHATCSGGVMAMALRNCQLPRLILQCHKSQHYATADHAHSLSVYIVPFYSISSKEKRRKNEVSFTLLGMRFASDFSGFCLHPRFAQNGNLSGSTQLGAPPLSMPGDTLRLLASSWHWPTRRTEPRLTSD